MRLQLRLRLIRLGEGVMCAPAAASGGREAIEGVEPDQDEATSCEQVPSPRR